MTSMTKLKERAVKLERLFSLALERGYPLPPEIDEDSLVQTPYGPTWSNVRGEMQTSDVERFLFDHVFIGALLRPYIEQYSEEVQIREIEGVLGELAVTDGERRVEYLTLCLDSFETAQNPYENETGKPS